jgi:hypothetical protein
VSPAFGKLAEDDQLRRMARLQTCAEKAGLRGTVVPVWKNDDTYEFLTPSEFAEFFDGLAVDRNPRANSREVLVRLTFSYSVVTKAPRDRTLC